MEVLLLFALSLEPSAQKLLNATRVTGGEQRSFHFVVRRWHFVLSRLWNAWFATHSVSSRIIQHVFRQKNLKKRPLLPLCNLSDYAVASFKYLGSCCIFICRRNFWKLRFRQWNVTTVWNVDLKKWEEPIGWKRIWEKVPLSSQGHQMMHSCLTPRRRFHLQLC